MKVELQEKEELYEISAEDKRELYDYKVSFYKWGSYFFKLIFITMAALLFSFSINFLLR